MPGATTRAGRIVYQISSDLNTEEYSAVPTILVLEDDPAVMGFLSVILSSSYTVLGATDVDEILEKLSEYRRTVNLMIADIILRRGSGIDAALAVRDAIPELPIILTSGYPESMWSESDVNYRRRIGLDSVRVLQKPFSPAKLLIMVSDLLHESICRGEPANRAVSAVSGAPCQASGDPGDQVIA